MMASQRHQGPGRIDSDLYLLGEAEVPVFLLQTDDASWALVEGGVAASAGAVWEQLLAIVGDPARVSHWLITHQHYDHCGLLPYLAPRLPNVRILASQASCRAWHKPAAQDVIERLNRQVGAAPPAFAAARAPWEALPLHGVEAGQDLVLGPRCVMRVLAAPGHARDQVVYYDAARERLFASDALGELDDADGLWRPLVFDDYAQYLATLAQLRELPVRQLIPGHGGMLTGAIAARAAHDAWRECLRLEQRLHWRLARADGLESLAHELHAAWGPQSRNFVPPDLHLASMRRMNGLIASAPSSTSRS